jgi:serine/threonine-protein kinase
MTQPKELSGRIGKYEILRVLGRGAMGIVYVAHDTVLERDVALKLMASSIADDPSTIDRFTREAKAVAKMTHPNVVTVFDLGSHTDGSPFIAMELLKGQDLQRALRTPPALTLERKLSVLVQVLAGLDHAHQAGIVHRDIKPANIFICTDGTVKIMDFGVARLATASMTGTGKIVGTADYMSPEQVKGAKVDGRSDIFSVGCMLYELLAGRRPFHSDNLMAIFYKITHEEPEYDKLPGEASDLLPILRKSMAKELPERYQTARDLAADLREYLRTYMGSRSAARALDDLLDGASPAGAALAGATVVDADPMPSTFRPAPTAPAPSGVQPTLPDERVARTVTPDVGATEIVSTPAVPARPQPARRPATIPPPRPVAPRSGSKGLLIGGGVAVAAVGLAVVAWLTLRQAEVPEAQPPATVAAVSSPTVAVPVETAPPVTAPPVASSVPPRVETRPSAAPSAALPPASTVPPPTTAIAAPPVTAPVATAPPATQASRALQLLTQADNALLARNYDAAIAAYEEALKLDPQNAQARQGRSTAIQARTLATAAAAAPPGRAFVSGRTKAASAETRAASAGPAGFEGGGEVVVKSATQAAQLPGKIVFDVDPEVAKAGEAYKIRIYLVNEGNAPIEVQGMVIATSINGKSVRGAVPPLSKEVAPRQRALLRELPDTWKEATTSWSMEVTVRTPRGETYTNQVTWQ